MTVSHLECIPKANHFDGPSDCGDCCEDENKYRKLKNMFSLTFLKA